MLQAGTRARFAIEPLTDFLCHIGARADGLKGDLPVQGRIAGTVDDSHGAGTQLFDDLVPATLPHITRFKVYTKKHYGPAKSLAQSIAAGPETGVDAAILKAGAT